MRKALSLLLMVPVTLVVLLAGCAIAPHSSGSPGSASSGNVPVSLSMTDDPPAGVSVLFFQVSLTDATLTSSSGSTVSLLSNNTPINIDVTQLQTLSDFLSTADVAAGQYSSLSLTFANPEVVIYNASDTSLGSTCAVGSVCQLTPTVDNSATVNFSSSPFPVTLSASSPLGFLVDFHLNTVIQPDLSVNLGAANAVTVQELPSSMSKPRFGTVTGEVESVSASNNQFTMLTKWGRTFTVNTTSSTAFDEFPTSACSAAGIGCVATGQIVQVQVASFAKGGVLTASQVTYVQAASQQTVDGTIIDMVQATNTNAQPTLYVLLHDNPANSSGFPLGGVAKVAISNSTTWSVDNNGFTIPAALSFTGANDLMIGQNVQIGVESGTLSSTSGQGWGGWGPPRRVSFTASSVALEPSYLTGTITALDSGAESFTLGFNLGKYFAAWPMAAPATISFNVQTTSQTTYTGFTTDSFDGLAAKNFVSVSGWMFPPATSGGPPQIVAQGVMLRSGGWY